MAASMPLEHGPATRNIFSNSFATHLSPRQDADSHRDGAGSHHRHHKHPSSSSTNVGAIVGGVLGGVLFLVLVGLLLWYWRRHAAKSRKHAAEQRGKPNEDGARDVEKAQSPDGSSNGQSSFHGKYKALSSIGSIANFSRYVEVKMSSESPVAESSPRSLQDRYMTEQATSVGEGMSTWDVPESLRAPRAMPEMTTTPPTPTTPHTAPVELPADENEVIMIGESRGLPDEKDDQMLLRDDHGIEI